MPRRAPVGRAEPHGVARAICYISTLIPLMKSRIFNLGTFIALALLAPVGACMPDDTPVIVRNTGTGGSPPVVYACAGSSGTSTLGTWANVRDVINGEMTGKGCYGSDCHTQGDREPYLLALESAPLPEADLYAKLTTYKTTKCGQRPLVAKCAPQESAFYLAQMGMCGDIGYMPSGCDPAYDNCTPMEKIEGIWKWIAEGAPGP